MKIRETWGISFLCLVLFSMTSPAFGRTAPILSAGDHVWFATKRGLYRYDGVQDEWSIFSAGSGLAGNDVRDIGIDEGIIWTATDRGASNSDVRFSDWRSYATDDGLPSDDVRCVAFSEDYVWIGTDGGVARFDKLLEEWESYTESDGLAGDQVNDIAADGETIWFATSNGISKFDVEFDKWTNYTHEAELPSANVTWAVVLGEYVWFVTDEGLARYDKRLRSWKSYSMADGIVETRHAVSLLINDVVIDGENIWLATEDGVSSYDPISDSWSPGLVYHTMLPSKNVTDLAMDGDIIWFCTDNGVSSYDSETGSWRYYTIADGLLDNSGRGLGVVGGQVLVVTEKGINLYDKKLQEWDTYEFSEEIAGDAGEARRERGLRIDERGIGYDLSREMQARLSGLSSLEFADVSSLRPERRDEYEWDAKSDVSLRGTMPGERSVVGFYNDTDEDDVEYGLTYRGNDTDLVQEATGGEFEVRMRNSELIEDINLVGAGALLRRRLSSAGALSHRTSSAGALSHTSSAGALSHTSNAGALSHRTRLNIEPRYGQQRGYFETDFFTYRTGTTIYHLSHRNVIPETDEVSVDKERLQRGVDYLIVYPSGWLVFHREELIEEGGEIEARYQYEPTDEEYEDRRLAILTAGVDLGDDYYTGLDMLHGDDLDVVSLNGEGKNMGMGPVSMKLRPEIAYSTGRSNPDTTIDSIVSKDNVASRAELIANAPRTQFRADYEGYGEDFWTIGRRETRFGELDRHLGVFSQVDITQWMPLTLRWQQDRSSDDMLTTSEQRAKMNIVLSRKPYPTVAATGERNTVNSSEQEGTENAARADFQYDLPQSLLSQVKFRKAEVNGYYREAHRRSVEHAASLFNMNERYKTQTGYAKLNLYPMEQFVLSTSCKLNRAKEKEAGSKHYQLREELQRLLVRSNFSSIDGVMSTFHLDDLRFRSRAAGGDLVEDKDRYLAASLNLIPGAWTSKLRMLTVAGRYSLIQQTVPVEGSLPEEAERADSNSRSLRLQANLRPHSAVSWTGTYQRMKSWIDGTPPVGNTRKYRSEAEFKPGLKSRAVLEYSQEHEDEDSTLQKRLYSPSLWWETRWSRSWTTRLRSIYEYIRIREKGEISETGSTLTPSLSFRYTARELPYKGRLYLSQGFSISIYRAERDMRDLASETYSTSFVTEWKITRNLSLRLRASISYEDNRTQGGSDKASANVYARAAARL